MRSYAAFEHAALMAQAQNQKPERRKREADGVCGSRHDFMKLPREAGANKQAFLYQDRTGYYVPVRGCGVYGERTFWRQLQKRSSS
jgi:hypothetical protein